MPLTSLLKSSALTFFLLIYLSGCGSLERWSPDPQQQEVASEKLAPKQQAQEGGRDDSRQSNTHTQSSFFLDQQDDHIDWIPGTDRYRSLEKEIFSQFQDPNAYEVEAFRKAYQEFEDVFNEEQIEMQIWERFVETLSMDIPVLVYEPNVQNDSSAAILLIHGGYHIAGSHTGIDHAARLLAQQTQLKVVTVGYRLAPESKFPSALEDVMAVSKWLSENGDAWGIDPNQLLAVGEGTGASLLLAALVEQADDSIFMGAVLVDGIYSLAANEPLGYADHKAFVLASQTFYQWTLSQYIYDRAMLHDPSINLVKASLTQLPHLYLVSSQDLVLQHHAYLLAQQLLISRSNYSIEIWEGVPRGAILAAQLMPALDKHFQQLSLRLLAMLASN